MQDVGHTSVSNVHFLTIKPLLTKKIFLVKFCLEIMKNILNTVCDQNFGDNMPGGCLRKCLTTEYNTCRQNKGYA